MIEAKSVQLSKEAKVILYNPGTKICHISITPKTVNLKFRRVDTEHVIFDGENVIFDGEQVIG